MSLLSPEQQQFIRECRAKFQAGEPVSVEDMKRAIIILRGSRTASIEANTSSNSKPKKKAPAVADVLSALDAFENF
jgi:hypothetical protein